MELHPLCSVFPIASPIDFQMLLEDIAKHGLKEPIVIYEGKVLDGQNRLRACEHLGITPRFIEFDGDDILSYVITKNLARRHLSGSQKAAIVSAFSNFEVAYKQGGNRKKQDNNIVLKSVEDRSKLSGASPEIQRKADFVAREDRSLICEVSTGKIRLSTAYKIIKNKIQESTIKPHEKNQQAKKSSPTTQKSQHTILELQKEIFRLSAANSELRRQINYFCGGFGKVTNKGWRKKV